MVRDVMKDEYEDKENRRFKSDVSKAAEVAVMRSTGHKPVEAI